MKHAESLVCVSALAGKISLSAPLAVCTRPHHFVGCSQIQAQPSRHSAHQQQEDGGAIVELIADALALLLGGAAVKAHIVPPLALNKSLQAQPHSGLLSAVRQPSKPGQVQVTMLQTVLQLESKCQHTYAATSMHPQLSTTSSAEGWLQVPCMQTILNKTMPAAYLQQVQAACAVAEQQNLVVGAVVIRPGVQQHLQPQTTQHSTA